MVFSDDFLHFLKIKKKILNSPKLSCGFNNLFSPLKFMCVSYEVGSLPDLFSKLCIYYGMLIHCKTNMDVLQMCYMTIISDVTIDTICNKSTEI